MSFDTPPRDNGFSITYSFKSRNTFVKKTTKKNTYIINIPTKSINSTFVVTPEKVLKKGDTFTYIDKNGNLKNTKNYTRAYVENLGDSVDKQKNISETEKPPHNEIILETDGNTYSCNVTSARIKDNNMVELRVKSMDKLTNIKNTDTLEMIHVLFLTACSDTIKEFPCVKFDGNGNRLEPNERGGTFYWGYEQLSDGQKDCFFWGYRRWFWIGVNVESNIVGIERDNNNRPFAYVDYRTTNKCFCSTVDSCRPFVSE